MTQHNLTQILKVIRDFVMRSRPCYRDYLGSETETKTVQIGSGVFKEFEEKGAIAQLVPTHPAFTGFVLGETYTVTIDGVAEDYVARNLPTFSDENGPIIGTVTTFDMENYTFDGWLVIAGIFKDSVLCIAQTLDTSFAGKTISISQTKTETVKHYNTKLLPEYLLPTFLRKNVVASKSEVQKAQTTADRARNTADNAQIAANNAQTESSSALSKANTAKSTAEAAQSTANTAKSTADEAKTKAINAYTKASIAETTAQNAVSFTTTQSCTDTEKKTARDNIGASSFSGNFTDLDNQVVGMKSKLKTAHISTYIIPASNEQLNGVYISHCQEAANLYASIVEFGGVFYGTRLAEISTNPATP